MTRRLSPQSAGVLGALADDPARWRYGYELGQQVGLRAGSLYPILMRLSERGLLDSSWETDPPPGRPPRHLYRLTALGEQIAAAAPMAARASASASAPAVTGGTRARGTRARGTRALGTRALGTQALATQALGTQALGNGALGPRRRDPRSAW